MVVKKTIRRVALVLAALGITAALGVWVYTACPSCPTTDCDRQTAKTAPAPTPPASPEKPQLLEKFRADDGESAKTSGQPKKRVAKAPAEVRRIRSKIRTGPLLKRPDYDEFVIEMEPVEPEEEEEATK